MSIKPMSNKEIRRKAWGLTGRNLHRIFAMVLVYALIIGVVGGVSAAFARNQIIAPVIILGLVMVAFVPVLETGMIQYAANIWRGRKPRLFHSLFRHTRHILRLWGIMLLTSLILIGVMLPWMIGMVAVNVPMINEINEISVTTAAVMTETEALATMDAASNAIAEATMETIFAHSGSLMISLALAMMMAFVMIWVTIRLSLTIVAYVLKPARTAGQCIKLSMRASKGNCWRIFCHNFMMALPMFIVEILVSLVSVALVNVDNRIVVAVVQIVTLLIETLFAGYIMLGSFGLYRQLIKEYTAPKKRALPAPEAEAEAQ